MLTIDEVNERARTRGFTVRKERDGRWWYQPPGRRPRFPFRGDPDNQQDLDDLDLKIRAYSPPED